MYLPREKKILKMLLTADKTFTVSEIAAELKVSPRTIKTDIKRINSELEKNDCCIQTKRGVGLWLHYKHPDGEQQIKRMLAGSFDPYIAAEARKYYIAAKLLNQQGCIAMETIANDFFVSKATVNNDIKELEPFWNRFELECVKRARYGVMIVGHEKKIRKALFDVMKSITKYSEKQSLENVQELFEDVDLTLLREVIYKTEDRFNFVLTDVSFGEFLIQIAIILQRAQAGCLFEEEITHESSDERKEKFVVSFMREEIEEVLGCQVPECELKGIQKSLRGLRFQVPLIKETEQEALEKRESEMFGYMMEVLREVDEKYMTELEDDEEFICSLFPHLECMVHRVRSEMYFENPLLEDVKKEMFYEYEIASFLISKFTSKYGIEATEDEIGYITFHIGTSIERTARKRVKIPKATLVCMAGIGSAQFLSVKLQRVFAELEIERVISSSMAQKLRKEEQDFVISTVPLELEDIDVLQVSLTLNEEDIQKIRKYIGKWTSAKEERNNKYLHLKRLWHEETSILGCDLNYKEEAIEVLGRRMIREGYVDAGYIESVFEREKLSETCVGGLIAIPHAFEGHILKPGIGLLTLRKPIAWGRENVQIVFMLALDANCGADFQEIFKAVFNLTKNFKDVEKILKAPNLNKLKKSIGD